MKMTWHWIAGFVEGEGHIYWQEGRRGTKQGMRGSIIIGQKDPSPLAAIREFLLTNGFGEPAFYLRPAAKSSRSSPCWILTVQRRSDVIRMLKAIAPLLIQKKEKANFVLARLRKAVREREVVLSKALKMVAAGKSTHQISKALKMGRGTLSNYARSKGILLTRHKRRFENSYEYRLDLVSRGLCSECGKSRGINGTSYKCRKCADKYNSWRNEHRRLYGRKDRLHERRRPDLAIDHEIVLVMRKP